MTVEVGKTYTIGRRGCLKCSAQFHRVVAADKDFFTIECYSCGHKEVREHPIEMTAEVVFKLQARYRERFKATIRKVVSESGKVVVENTCAWCGKKFPRARTVICCSPTCQYERNRVRTTSSEAHKYVRRMALARARGNPPQEVLWGPMTKCPICGKKFSRKTTTQRCCKRPCKLVMQAKRTTARRKKARKKRRAEKRELV